MINAERVKQMVKLESFDEKKKDKLMPVIKYFRVDYVGMHILRALLSITVACALFLAFSGFANMEYLMENIHTMDLKEFIRSIIVRYVIVTVIYTVIVAVYANFKYSESRTGVKGQRFRLKKLFKTYDSNGGDK
ncbi:MAG: hypothetical protein K6E56_04020 [Lachnospiraceae bacterium]|nr:hypothetical protein [Lachnospiraceae bacterium]